MQIFPQVYGLDTLPACIHDNMKSKASPAYVPPSRQGKHLIGAHFPAETKRKLKSIAAEQDTSVQALLESAVSEIIKKHEKNKARVAG